MKGLLRGGLCTSAWLIKLGIVLSLISCEKLSHPDFVDYRAEKLASYGTITKLEYRLVQQRVKIICIGQNYLIIIPARLLFKEHSPHLRWKSYLLLNNVAQYLQQFRKVSVQVSTYHNKDAFAKRESALTTTRSTAIANYLWSQGIDSRFILTRESNNNQLMFNKGGYGDESGNSRVEITFRTM